ncbi:MAG: 50S ribosomal protein L3 [candidate division WOR-3 bacterium]
MCGIIAKKIGMTRLFDEDGNVIPVTVLDFSECYVLDIKNKEKDGYNAVRLCFGNVKQRKINKPTLGVFKKVFGEREFYPARIIKEIRTDEIDKLVPGEKVKVNEIFQIKEKVDVIGKTKGRGFAGVVKRWDFKGGPDSHGSMFHRRPGSIGQTTDPGRVWKGKKMAGHYGNERVTIHNLEVVKIDQEKEVILLKGAVPGPRGSYVIIRKAKRRRL